MFNWRNALGLAVIFIGVGLIYWFGWSNFDYPEGIDMSGVVMLCVLGIAMTFAFVVMLRNSREL